MCITGHLLFLQRLVAGKGGTEVTLGKSKPGRPSAAANWEVYMPMVLLHRRGISVVNDGREVQQDERAGH